MKKYVIENATSTSNAAPTDSNIVTSQLVLMMYSIKEVAVIASWESQAPKAQRAIEATMQKRPK
jgi:hypothetical protein